MHKTAYKSNGEEEVGSKQFRSDCYSASSNSIIDLRKESGVIPKFGGDPLQPIKSIEVLPKVKFEDKDYFVFQQRTSNAYQTI